MNAKNAPSSGAQHRNTETLTLNPNQPPSELSSPVLALCATPHHVRSPHFKVTPKWQPSGWFPLSLFLFALSLPCIFPSLCFFPSTALFSHSFPLIPSRICPLLQRGVVGATRGLPLATSRSTVMSTYKVHIS